MYYKTSVDQQDVKGEHARVDIDDIKICISCYHQLKKVEIITNGVAMRGHVMSPRL